ncbi:MAG TPA: hypothetical protein VF633_13085 [Brevundimonas sp.]
MSAIIVAPLHEVDEAIRIWAPSHVIGLASPGAEIAGPVEGVERLQLTFHDIAEPQPGLQPVTENDVERLLAFGQSWSGAAPLMIQCWAGVSRSTAAAYAIACMVSSSDEDQIARALRLAAPFATPNRRLVALADAALRRDGRLIAAISGIGRGAEVSMGSTFRLQV